MSTQPLDHEQVIALLPDYAIGALEPADLDRVELHLEGCPECRTALLSILELGALISDVAPPEPGVRQRLLSKASHEVAPIPAPGVEPEPDRPAPVPISGRLQLAAAGRRWGAQALLAATAALLIIGLGIWNLRLREANQQVQTIAEILSSATVYPLTESQVSPPASGVLLVGAGDRRALLIANDLPPLADSEEYRIWLFDERGQPSPGSVLTADAAGRSRTEITLPQPLASYVAVAVSAEPAGGDGEGPSGPLALGGWLGTP